MLTEWIEGSNELQIMRRMNIRSHTLSFMKNRIAKKLSCANFFDAVDRIKKEIAKMDCEDAQEKERKLLSDTPFLPSGLTV